jgi:hypothetical protein
MRARSVDVVENITTRDFEQKYLDPQIPLIIKGLADKYPAGRKWTIDYMREVCGDVMVDMYDNKNKNSESAYTRPDLKMKFADYIDTIIENKPTTLRMFLFDMFKCKPQLRNDFPCPEIFRGIMGKIGFMFFGAKGIKVRIHQDMDMSNVLLTQFYGRKKVVLIDPKYSRLLYKLPFNTHSLVDLDAPDYEKYPGLKYIETYECILEHGDSLFMPSGYWHYITYLDGGFSVSYRKMAHSIAWKARGFLSLCVYMPADKLMNKLIGKRWLALKERIAVARAKKEIERSGGDDEPAQMPVERREVA